MSNMCLSFHNTQKVTAEVRSGAEWVELTVADCNGTENEVAIFFKPRGLAERFAAAVNAVNDEVAAIVAQHREMDVKGRIPASHTDAFGDQSDFDDEKAHGWAAEGVS